MDIDLREYLQDYLVELEEHLADLNNNLLEIEKDPENSPLIDALFRTTHTIKGNAGTMGFTDINRVGHAMEDLMGEVRAKRMTINAPAVEALFNGYDIIVELKNAIVDNRPSKADVGAVVDELHSIMADAGVPVKPPPGKAAAAHAAPPAPASQARPPGDTAAPAHEINYYIFLEFEPDMVMKAVRAFLVLNKLKDVGNIVESVPTAREIEEDRPFDVLMIKLVSKAALAKLNAILSFGEAKQVVLEPLSADRAREPLSSLAGGIHGQERPAAAPPEPAAPVAPPPAAAPPAPPPRAPAPEPQRPAQAPPDAPAPRQRPAVPAAPSTAPPDASGSIQEYVDGLTDDQKALIAEALQGDLNVLGLDLVYKDRSENSRIRAMAQMNQLQDLGQLIAARPRKEALFEGEFLGRIELVISTEREAGQVRRVVASPDLVRSHIETLVLEGARIISLEGREAKRTRPTLGPAVPGAAKTEERKSPAAQTVRVGVDRLDHLMNLVGELVIAKTQLVQLLSHYQPSSTTDDVNTAITALNQKLTWITNALQTGIMKVRMVQIGQVFFRFSRLVRDLSKALGKQVDFMMEGTETELDKTVIDEIGDPLMHLIRNALDHGVESPETRKALGKSERGILLLRAQQVGDHIIVEVVDDGSGLNLDKIKQRALERQLIDPGLLKTMNPTDIYNFIFLPGFSTADKISTVSGRGVGMDVVKDAIENLAGDIQIKSEPNTGTTVQIKLPLTLAIIQGLLVRVAKESFAIPLSTVKETVLLNDAYLHVINNHKAVMFRDEIIPLIYLDQFFGLGDAESKKNFIVFAGDDDNKIGLVVNSLIGRREIVIKSLDKRYVDVKGFAGATILGDGTVSLILDVPALVEEARGFFVS